MPQQTKIFRLFVSSTFTDMKEERRILQREVFPKLEKYCESNGAKFQAVDLRWGVNEESALNQKTIEICLNEVTRCQKLSPKPNFLILLGNKYGWQPIPSKIPKEEMNLIFGMLEIEEKELIEEWYKLDENAIPAEYVIQAREGNYKVYNIWKIVESKIQNIFRKSISSLGFTVEQKAKYYNSATHLEILNGALNPPSEIENPEEHVLACIRNIQGLPDDESARDFIDIKDGMKDAYSIEQLKNLKSSLKEKLGDNCIIYSSIWRNGLSEIDDVTEFSQKIYSFLEGIIKEQLKKIITTDEIENEVMLHKQFKERLTEHFGGRTQIVERIQSYINSPFEKKTLSIVGESGSGKSSVIAEAIKKIDENEFLVFYRFIGTTSNSANIISLLISLCGQIAKSFGVTLESLADEGREKSIYDLNRLSEIFRNCLALGTSEKPLIIFLDALDQLSDTNKAKSFFWLPKELPENVKIVVSVIPEFEMSLSETHIEHLHHLPEAEGNQILKQWFAAIKRKLSDDQHDLVIDNFNKTGLPIYLKLAFEKSKQWHSYDKNLVLAIDVKGIINEFFDLLEHEHPEKFVVNAISYMLCGKYEGLAENEILEILAADDEYWKIFISTSHPDHKNELEDLKKELKEEMKIPMIVWSKLYLDLEPYLTERDADGIPIITFFHRQFVEVLKERYELVEENAKS